MKSDTWAPPYSQNGMIITPREYSTVRLGVESGSYRSIESLTIRGHPYIGPKSVHPIRLFGPMTMIFYPVNAVFAYLNAFCLHRRDTSSVQYIMLLQTKREWMALLEHYALCTVMFSHRWTRREEVISHGVAG